MSYLRWKRLQCLSFYLVGSAEVVLMKITTPIVRQFTTSIQLLFLFFKHTFYVTYINNCVSYRKTFVL